MRTTEKPLLACYSSAYRIALRIRDVEAMARLSGSGRKYKYSGLQGWSVLLAIIAVVVAACTGNTAGKQDGIALSSETTTDEVIAAPASERISFSKSGWKTNFSRHSIPLSEIIPGGPPRDGIPPIDKPHFVSLTEGDSFLKDTEPVIVFEHRGDARAYPLQILIWHEIVNDTVGGLPVAITFCPLCNTAIAFDRRLEGQVLDFGTTGNLRHSDLVMWDRQTESWWQQITGEAIVGELTSKRLTLLPAAIVSWRDFRATYPQGQVLSRRTGYDRPYGTNPYVGYDDINDSPFLFKGRPDRRLPPMERVVTVEINGGNKW